MAIRRSTNVLSALVFGTIFLATPGCSGELATEFLSGFEGAFNVETGTCKEVTTVENFDLEQYVSAPWYIQQQAVNGYQPADSLFCVRADYRIKSSPNLWGYTIDVYNQNQDSDGGGFGLCAYNRGPEASKLAVAPCFLPTFLAGDYWVLDYDERNERTGGGYTLVSGGQPFIPNGNGKCSTGTGINNSGLWILTRLPNPPEYLINDVRDIADEKGFDVSVLIDVPHDNCDYIEVPEEQGGLVGELLSFLGFGGEE